MRYSRHRGTRYFSGYFPPGVKWLLLANVAVYLAGFFSMLLWGRDPFRLFGLVPYQVVSGYLWQPFTYLFLHGGLWHIVFNMLALWFFGPTLERDWGTKRFLQYYFLCGVGAAICVIALAFVVDAWRGIPTEAGLRTIGASGALFGILLAYGVLYPNAMVLYDFLFPIKAKYFVLIVGAIAFLGSLTPGQGISHVAHLGGMLFGYAYLKSPHRRPWNPLPSMRQQVENWRLRRARRKFQVYLRKRDGGPDRRVN
jgi:membrane associated rhomboid family serine protease